MGQQANLMKKVGLLPLLAIVISSMIGSGIFAMPQNMGASAAPYPLVIGWIVTGIGIVMMAFVYQRLAVLRPDLDAGIFSYARAGFGRYVGFNSSWGYWVSAWAANVGYLVLTTASLSYWIPSFGEGNTVPAILFSSILLWGIHFLVLRGFHGATVVNAVVTVIKIVPIFVFLFFVFKAFSPQIFSEDLWGTANPSLGGTFDQVRNMMLVTVWAFIGFEGANMISQRAKKRSDIGVATIGGIVFVVVLLILVSLLSYGSLSQEQLGALSNPSMAPVLEHIVGPWGGQFISIAVVISVMGAFLSWVLLSAEILSVTAKDSCILKSFAQENKAGTPTTALWITNICVQIFLIITYYNDSTYLDIVYLSTSMILIPYLLSSLYFAKLVFLEKKVSGFLNMKIALIASVYGIWLIYAAGLKYLYLSSLMYAVGLIIYYFTRKESGSKLFDNKAELILAVFFVVCGAMAAYQLYTGQISL